MQIPLTTTHFPAMAETRGSRLGPYALACLPLRRADLPCPNRRTSSLTLTPRRRLFLCGARQGPFDRLRPAPPESRPREPTRPFSAVKMPRMLHKCIERPARSLGVPRVSFFTSLQVREDMGADSGCSGTPSSAPAPRLWSVLELVPAEELDRVLHAHHPEITATARDAIVNGVAE